MTPPIFSELPTKLGIYNLTQLLGAREVSELYLATQSYVDRAVAIEVLRPELGDGEGRFRDASRLRAAVSLPHVAPVLESARTGNLHYLIQEVPAGQPLQELETKLSTDQAFSLIQAAAELYCACAEQGVAARPLMLHDIYVAEKETFSFFSPVVGGEMTDELRAEQMEELANILEYCMDEADVAGSNISIIIHWLRHGYGNSPLQWKPLAASLSTLRAAKRRPRGGVFGQKLRELFGNKRTRRTALRYVLFGLLLLGIVGGVGAVGLFFEEDVHRELPAVDEEYVYCRSAGNAWRVLARPVSVEAYGKFLEAWEAMSRGERESLCEGMPEEVTKERMPLQWAEQAAAAISNRDWHGLKMTPESPVRGVSRQDAVIYARYMNSELADADMVSTARRHAGEPLVAEWTSQHVEAHTPYEAYDVVYPAYGTVPIRELNPAKRDANRGFRVANKIQP